MMAKCVSATLRNEVRVCLVLGKYALRLAGGWRSLLRDMGTETYSDANTSPAMRLRCDLLLRLALVNLGPLAARRVPQSACRAALKPFQLPFSRMKLLETTHSMPLSAYKRLRDAHVFPARGEGPLDCLRPLLFGVSCRDSLFCRFLCCRAVWENSSQAGGRPEPPPHPQASQAPPHPQPHPQPHPPPNPRNPPPPRERLVSRERFVRGLLRRPRPLLRGDAAGPEPSARVWGGG